MITIFAILFLLLPQLSLQQEEGHLHPTESFLLTFESEAEQQEGGAGGEEEEEGLETRTWEGSSSIDLSILENNIFF